MTVKEAAPVRSHDAYFDSPAWTVVDIDGVDKVFATRTDENELRIDIDGRAEPSSEDGHPGDRINVSVWLSDDQLRAILNRLEQ